MNIRIDYYTSSFSILCNILNCLLNRFFSFLIFWYSLARFTTGSINKIFNEAHFSEAYEKVLHCLVEDEEPSEADALGELLEIGLHPKELSQDVEETVKEKLRGLVLRRRKMREKYVEEYR